LRITFSARQRGIIDNLYRALIGFLWLAPLIGAAENKSGWPLLLLIVPVACRSLPKIHSAIEGRCLQRPIVMAGIAVLAALIGILIHLGLHPVGGVLGPGGWYLPLAIACILLSVWRSAETQTTFDT
jgi:hypothetical protein